MGTRAVVSPFCRGGKLAGPCTSVCFSMEKTFKSPSSTPHVGPMLEKIIDDHLIREPISKTLSTTTRILQEYRYMQWSIIELNSTHLLLVKSSAEC